MKRLIFFTLIFALPVLFAGCSRELSLATPQKSIIKHRNHILIEGRWKETGGSGTPFSPVNAVKISCNKDIMACEEEVLSVYLPKDSVFHTHEGRLAATKTILEVVEWTPDDLIKARCQEPGADTEIRISVEDNFVERSFRETRIRGSEKADPNVFSHYVLG